jgi:2-polyprenyl-3-methyl-5-hydroxy-6-metoxy-1,4-benzoquinol methylase
LKQAIEHQVPNFLKPFPWLMRWVHFAQRITYQRHTLIRKVLKKDLQEVSRVWDAGCGDGQYSFFVLNQTSANLVSSDINQGWVTFLNNYWSNNRDNTRAQAVCQGIEDSSYNGEFDAVICVSVLPYVRDVGQSLVQMREALKPSGKLYLYCPVNFYTETRLYRRMFDTYNNSENAANFRRVFTSKELRKLVEVNGFQIEDEIFTYGKCGRFGHEIWSIVSMWLGSSSFFLRAWGFLWMVPAALTVKLLQWIDFRQKLNDGNGVLLILNRANSHE